MVRKKENFSEWSEEQDGVTAEVEVVAGEEKADPGTTGKPTVSTPKVTIKEEPAPEGPQLSEQTKAEMAAGKKAVEEAAKKQAEQAKKPE
jgi:hypothetical protein